LAAELVVLSIWQLALLAKVKLSVAAYEDMRTAAILCAGIQSCRILVIAISGRAARCSADILHTIGVGSWSRAIGLIAGTGAIIIAGILYCIRYCGIVLYLVVIILRKLGSYAEINISR
jgi:hypothetical protein